MILKKFLMLLKGGHKMKDKKIMFVFFLLFSISMISLFALAQGVGYIQIKCEPGATVFLDNKLVGNTTSELDGLILQDVPAGSHEVKIVKEGCNPQSVKIDLKVNEIYLYEVSLKQKIGALLVETIPIDCIIEIPLLNIDKEHEGNKIEKTWEVSIPIGSYRINFLALGKKVKYDLEIEEGTRKHLLVNILNNEVKELLPILTWERTYGGSGYDAACSLIQTADGGYGIAGSTSSKGAGSTDVWIIKLDIEGNILWDKTYGGDGEEYAEALIQTADGGYGIAGSTSSKGAGSADVWIIKLDIEGNILWDKTYGGDDKEYAYSLIQTIDGGYTVAGSTGYKGAGGVDIWILKLDSHGNLLWDKTYGGSGSDRAFSIIQTNDDGYAVAANTEDCYVNGVIGSSVSDGYPRLLKLDSQGDLLWSQPYGEWACSLIQTADGGYAVAGSTSSKGAGGTDFWVIKLDREGNLLWDRTYGGSSNDSVLSIIQTVDGGYAVAGGTSSKGAGAEDFWVIKLDKQGNKIWDRTYGGSKEDWAFSLIQTTDGGYAVAGWTDSKGAGKEDFWVIKLDEQGNLISGVEDSEAVVEVKDTDKNFDINDYKAQTETEANTTSIQTITVPIFDSYQWEVGLPGFAKPGEITKFKDTTISTVQLSRPLNGATLSPGNITFSWNPVSNATKYQHIRNHSLGKVGKGTVDTSSTSFTISLGTEETITWKVRAGDNSGNWGAWSNTWSLTLKSTTPISTDSSLQDSDTTCSLTGSLHCPDKRGYPCNSCSSVKGYINHFKGFNVLTTNEDCYVKLIYNNGAYIGNQNNCEVIIKGEKWLGLENESGTKLGEEINKGNFDFTRANKFVERIMIIPGDGYNYEFANEGKEFRLYLSRKQEEAFKAVPWQNIVIEIKNKETDKVFKYKFEKGIFPLAYSWSNGVANYGQCVWWVAKRWVEEVDSKTLFPFYPPSPEAVNVKTIDSNYQPKRFDVLIDYDPRQTGELGHYGFVEEIEGDKMYISQFNWIKPGEVYNYIIRTWNKNATNLFYSYNPSGEYYFKYYYRK